MNIEVFNQKDELFKTYNNVYAIDFDNTNDFGVYDNDSHKLLINLSFEKFYYVETYNKRKQKNNKSTLTISNKCISNNHFSFKIKDLDTGKLYLVKPKVI